MKKSEREVGGSGVRKRKIYCTGKTTSDRGIEDVEETGKGQVTVGWVQDQGGDGANRKTEKPEMKMRF